MLTTKVRLLFGREGGALSEQTPPNTAEKALVTDEDVSSVSQAAEAPARVWSSARLGLMRDLWGDGYICPGGDPEILRLTRPLGLSSNLSLLIVGVGAGGAAATVVRNLGAWVTGLESDADLLTATEGYIHRVQLGRKVALVNWDPNNPVFAGQTHHHCLALQPLHGAQPEPVLDMLVRALKPVGQLVMTELVADPPLNSADPVVRRWAELERLDPAAIPSGIAITRMIGRVGLDVRVNEDISPRQMEQALVGWRGFVRDLRGHRPAPAEAAVMVEEAELWLLRRRLMRTGRLKLMRWHAIGRPPRSQPGFPMVKGLSTA